MSHWDTQPRLCREYIVQSLVEIGVTHIFGGHGGAIVPLVDEIVKNPKITFVYTRCEVNASMMAHAYGKLTGSVGVCIATSGPGAGHVLSGLIDAEQDRVPVLCLTGLKASSHLRYSDFQDMEQVPTFKMAGISFSEKVGHIDQVMPLFRNAIKACLAGNVCAHLAIPQDIQLQIITEAPSLCRCDNFVGVKGHPKYLMEFLTKEKESGRKFVIACGWRANHLKLGIGVEAIAKFLDCPILTTFDGKGTVDEGTEKSFGVVGVYGNVGLKSSMDVIKEADTVIAVGMSDLTEFITGKNGRQIRHLIQIAECRTKGDWERFKADFIYESISIKEDFDWIAEQIKEGCTDCKDHSDGCWNDDIIRHKTMIPRSHVESSQFCHPAAFLETLSLHLEEDSIICADIGDNALWLASRLQAIRGQRTLTSEHMGIMGYALNAAIAASMVSGNASPQILAVAGDGGLQMSINELATAKQMKVKNTLFVVIVNGLLGRVNNEIWGEKLKALGTNIEYPNFVKLFDAYGYPGGIDLHTSEKASMNKAIEEGWEKAEKNGLCVIVVHQDPSTYPTMYKF